MSRFLCIAFLVGSSIAGVAGLQASPVKDFQRPSSSATAELNALGDVTTHVDGDVFVEMDANGVIDAAIGEDRNSSTNNAPQRKLQASSLKDFSSRAEQLFFKDVAMQGATPVMTQDAVTTEIADAIGDSNWGDFALAGGTATGNLVTTLLQGGNMAEAAKTQAISMGFELVGTIATLSSPMVGVAITMVTSILGGLLGGGGPSMMELILEKVKVMIDEAFMKDHLNSAKRHLMAVQEEIGWLPETLKGRQASDTVMTSWLLTVQHDMATLKSQVFGSCSEDVHSADCKRLSEMGLPQIAFWFAELHINTLLELGAEDPTLRDAVKQRMCQVSFEATRDQCCGYETILTKTLQTSEAYMFKNRCGGVCSNPSEMDKQDRDSAKMCHDQGWAQMGGCRACCNEWKKNVAGLKSGVVRLFEKMTWCERSGRPVAAAAPPPYQIKNKHGKCLDATKRDHKGGKVHMWSCEDYSDSLKDAKTSKNQAWVYDPARERIYNKFGYCLDASKKDDTGGLVHMWPCKTGEANQKWYYNPGTSQIVQAASRDNGSRRRRRRGIPSRGKMCLDGDRNKKGGKVHMWQCKSGEKNQQWTMPAWLHFSNKCFLEYCEANAAARRSECRCSTKGCCTPDKAYKCRNHFFTIGHALGWLQDNRTRKKFSNACYKPR